MNPFVRNIPALFFVLIFFCGCKVKSNNPEAVLISFMNAMHDKDFSAAKKLATIESKQFLDAMEAMYALQNKPMQPILSDYDITKMEFGETKIIKDIAKIRVKEKSDGGYFSPVYTLKKENGKWKVALDPISQIDLGSGFEQETINPEKNIQVIDSIYRLKEKDN